MKDKTEIEQIIEQAISPLKTEIAELKVQIAPLLAMVPKLPPTVVEAQEILKAIPGETIHALKVAGATFDPKMVWFQLHLADGRRISVKKNEFDFRVRVRDQNGVCIKELAPSANALPNALKSLT